MASPERQELIRNAVIFLRDPKTQSSSLVQRVQFLEAKGLTSSEIDEAMRQASGAGTAMSVPLQPHTPSYAPVYGPLPYATQSPHRPWDWRDYFIAGIVSGTIAYGAASLFKKYLLPHLRPPTATAYEADRDALTAQFDAAEAMLKEIHAETNAVRIAMEEQKEKVDKTTEEINIIIAEMRNDEAKTRDELREMREEVGNVRDMLPKMIDKSKENHTQSLAELQQELKSLKALLLSRGPNSSAGISTPFIPSKPSIPSWQLAGGSSGSLPSSPGISSLIPNGKGKDTDIPPTTSP